MNRQMKRMMKRQEAAEEARPRVRAGAAPAGRAPRTVRRGDDGRPKKTRTRPRTYVRESVAELKRVDWPSRRQVQTYTIVVLACVVVLGILLATFDLGVSKLVVKIFA